MDTNIEKQPKKVTQEDIKFFMEGSDPQEHIVNLSYNYQDKFITVFYRDENDQKCAQQQPFYPFVWATKEACLKLCDGDRKQVAALLDKYGIGVKKLSNVDVNGIVRHEFDNGYMFMFFAKVPMSYKDFLDFFKKAKNPIYSQKKKDESVTIKDDGNRQYLCVTPQEQFLISTGKRFFKGYNDYDELLRMIFDLETEGLNPEKHRIKMNGVRLNRPVTINGKHYDKFERIFRLTGNTEEEKDDSERQIIITMIKLIKYFQPDIITAHNGENFDWNFLIVRSTILGIPMEEYSKQFFNGEGIRKENKESILKLGGEIEKFRRTIVPNTIITDSLHAVRRAQATDSNFKKADLKYSTKYLSLNKDNRVYTPGNEIDNILVDKVNKYAFNDKNGDWYIYDENYIPEEIPDIIPDENKTVEYFNALVEEDRKENLRYPKEFDEYIKSIAPMSNMEYAMYLMETLTEEEANSISMFECDERYNKYIEDFNNSSHEDDYKKYVEDFERYEMYSSCKYSGGTTGESLYQDYLDSIKKQNEDKHRFKLGKEGDKPFVMYRRNYLAEGYEIVTGEYIIERYLYDDLWECDKVESKLNTSNFYLCKIMPIPFSKCTTMGTAGQWKAIMMSWSYENNLAIPKQENESLKVGGLSRLLNVGYSGGRAGSMHNIVKFDYNSLYPSIMLTWGIDDWSDLAGATLPMLEFVLTSRELYKGKKKAANKIIDKYDEKLLSGETLTPEEQNEYEKAHADFALFDKIQNNFKIVGNSLFGSVSASNASVYPWKSSKNGHQITCTGRQCLRLLISHFGNLKGPNGETEGYSYKPLVGDSFTGDTPMFIKYKKDNRIDIKPIEEMINEKEIQIDELGREYDYSKKDYYVLSRSGWIEPSYLYRHKTNKPIYEVKEDNAFIEVTEDHSLFDSNKHKIKPSEITNETKLEYYSGKINGLNQIITENKDNKIISVMAKMLANGEIDRVPVQILNATKKEQVKFYKEFIKYQTNDIKYSKTCLAGIQFIIK